MPYTELIILIGIGILFILLGTGAIILGKREEKKYFNSLSSRPDAREFLEGWPERPQFGSYQAGGWIAVIIGLLILVIGGVFAIWS